MSFGFKKGIGMTETPQESRKYGARVFKVLNDTLLIKQTVKRGRGQNDPYVIDEQNEKHVNLGDDAQIASAIRDAMEGKLAAGKQ